MVYIALTFFKGTKTNSVRRAFYSVGMGSTHNWFNGQYANLSRRRYAS